MKKFMPFYLILILITGASILSAQTCVSVSSLTGPGVDRSYRSAVSPNGVTYIDYRFSDDNPFTFQGNVFEATSYGLLMKLDKDNNLEWIQRYGTDIDNHINIHNILTDEEDNCIIHAMVVGTSDFKETTFTTSGEEWENLDDVVIRLNSLGELQWVSRFSEGKKMTCNGLGLLFFHTTLDGAYDFIFKDTYGDTTVYPKRSGAQNAVFAINTSNGKNKFFTRLRDYIGLINGNDYQTAICDLYSVNNEAYLSAYIVEGSSKTSRIFKCTPKGSIFNRKRIDGHVLALFESPIDTSFLYCHVNDNGSYYTRKYTNDFSLILSQSENTYSPIFSGNYIPDPNYFVDNNGNITAIINPYTPNYFTYNGTNVYENNTQWFSLIQLSSNLELLNFKPIIPGWGSEYYNKLYFLPNTNTFKLIGFGSIANQIDAVSYESEGYTADVFIFDFLNNANITHPEIVLADSVLSLETNESYQMTYTILESTGEETVEWTSLDTLTASVDSLGMLTGVSAGETTIIATIKASGMADSCSVTVTEPYAPQIVLSNSMMDLEVDASYQLSYTINNGNGEETVSWVSLEQGLASVTAEGLVTGLSAGEAHIVVQIDSSDAADTCLVTVTPGTGIKKVLKSDIKLFPNPINDYVHLEANSLINKIEVYDLAGKKVIETNKSGKIDLSHLYHGIYFFNVQVDGGQKFTYRMIKK